MTLVAAFLVAAVAIPAPAVLFPEPLHLVREIEDPISGTTVRIHEYCAGDRIVTVNGSLVVIADYGRQELTEVDRNAGTFSITSFADLARAGAAFAPREPAATAVPEGRMLGAARSADGRPLERFEFTQEHSGQRVVITVGVDRQVTLTPAAVEALIGAAFPNRRGFAHEAMLRAAAPPSPGRRLQTASVAGLALPSEHTVAIESQGETVTFRSSIVMVDRRLAPAELVTIPPGSRRVESKIVALPRVLQEIESLPPTPRP